MIETRKQEEIAFHARIREGQHEQRWSPQGEQRVADDPLWSNFKYYSIERHSLELSRRWLREYGAGATALDYCCGNGEDAVYLAECGANRVIGIDISDVSIRNCQERAAAAGVGDRVSFEVMDAEAMRFDANAFDLITEYGVLHHLELDKAMGELARVLKPEGQMLCTETLGHNPVIHWYRKRTPDLRTPWEVDHILTRDSFETIRRHFGRVEMHFFHLATLAAVPLRRTPVFSILLESLRLLDRVLLSVPGLRWQAWQVVFKLSDPVKARR